MSVSILGVETKWWTFPGGERNVQIIGPLRDTNTVICYFKSSDDIIDILLVTNAIRNIDNKVIINLCIPYFPAARQDRVMNPGEPFALQVMAQILNSCNFNRIEVWDPHSDVLAGLFPAGVLKVVDQASLWQAHILRFYNTKALEVALVSPDAGALKKIYKLAMLTNTPVIEASKKRDVSTGKITSSSIDTKEVKKYDVLYIVDDICDGGRTFIDLAEVIKRSGYLGKLVLCATHGIFSKGLDVLRIFDSIKVINNMSSYDLLEFNKGI